MAIADCSASAEIVLAGPNRTTLAVPTRSPLVCRTVTVVDDTGRAAAGQRDRRVAAPCRRPVADVDTRVDATDLAPAGRVASSAVGGSHIPQKPCSRVEQRHVERAVARDDVR